MDLESRSAHLERDAALTDFDLLLLSEISKHMDGLFGALLQLEVKAASIQEVRELLLDKFDELVFACSGIAKQLPSSQHNTSTVMSVILTLQIFKATQLSQRRMKARELLEVLNKAIPESVAGTAANPNPFSNPSSNAQFKLILGHLLSLNLDAAIAELRKLKNTDMNKKLIGLLQTRVNFIIDIKQLSRNQFIPNESFLKQVQLANQLISGLDEIHNEEEKRIYQLVLSLLAGDMRTLLDVTREEFLPQIRGYLIYIDPFLEKSAAYDKLFDQYKDKLDVRHLLVKMLNDKHSIQEVLLTVRATVPQFVYYTMCIYSFNMELTDLRFTNKKDSELQTLVEFFEMASQLKIDFMKMEPFARRVVKLSQGAQLSEEFKFSLQDICKSTLQDLAKTQTPEKVRKEQDYISHFLIDNGLSSINLAVNEFYFNLISQMPRAKRNLADYFLKVLSRDDTAEGYLMGQKHLDELVKDEVYERMIHRDFDALTQDLEDEDIIAQLASQMQQKKPDDKINLTNKLFSFLDSYIRLRQEIQRIKKVTEEARDSRSLQSATFSSLVVQLATEYCSSPILFKMVFSVLLGFRRLFRGSFKEVDQLIKVNNNMRANLRFLQKLGDRPDQELLSSIIHRANILLLEMRANC